MKNQMVRLSNMHEYMIDVNLIWELDNWLELVVHRGTYDRVVVVNYPESKYIYELLVKRKIVKTKNVSRRDFMESIDYSTLVIHEHPTLKKYMLCGKSALGKMIFINYVDAEMLMVLEKLFKEEK